LHQLYGA
jgi:hypothetical protein